MKNKFDLRSIPVPEYNYRALNYISKPNEEIQKKKTVNQVPQNQFQIDEFSSPSSSSVSASPTKNANAGIDPQALNTNAEWLLSTDNTYFLSSQLLNDCQPNKVPTNEKDSRPPKQNASTSSANQNIVATIQAPFRYMTFLHHFKISKISYGPRLNYNTNNLAMADSQTENEITLRLQNCDLRGLKISGECIKDILEFSDTEWSAIKALFQLIGKYNYDAHSAITSENQCFITRVLNCLFQSHSKFSNRFVQYVPTDFEHIESVIVCDSLSENNDSARLLTAIDPSVLNVWTEKD